MRVGLVSGPIAGRQSVPEKGEVGTDARGWQAVDPPFLYRLSPSGWWRRGVARKGRIGEPSRLRPSSRIQLNAPPCDEAPRQAGGPHHMAEDRGFEPLRAVNPTRFPSERHRPLGESSTDNVTGSPHRVSWRGPPVRRHHAQLPQGRKAARVSVLCRVCGGSLFFHAFSLRFNPDAQVRFLKLG